MQLACSSVLPWAVAAQHGATACGLPTAFVSDLFYTCLSGTLSKHVYVSPWAKSAPDFRIRGKFGACPTGDSNAGKSPVFNFVLDEYVATMQALKDRFPFSRSDFHIYSGGNHGGFNECMRATGGTCLYVGPEFKPMADPKFPSTGATDSSRFVDMPRLLETASGGKYSWDTATEAKAVRLANAMKSRPKSVQEAGGSSTPDSADLLKGVA